MKVRIRARARRDLDEIFAYSEAAHGDAAAVAYLRMIGAALDRLGDFPQLGSVRDLTPAVRSLPAGQHRIFYVVMPKHVSIVRVLHQAMDPARHL